MEILESKERESAKKYLEKAAGISGKVICPVRRIGAVLVKDGKVIGEGYNGPLQHSCETCLLDMLEKGVKTELCFAMHAEERALVDTLEKGHDPKGATLYSTYAKGDKLYSTEDSFCAHCSRILMESGISEVVLPQENKFISYPIQEFYDLSFDKFVKEKYLM